MLWHTTPCNKVKFWHFWWHILGLVFDSIQNSASSSKTNDGHVLRIVQECENVQLSSICSGFKMLKNLHVLVSKNGPLTLIGLSSYCHMAVALLMLNTAFKKKRRKKKSFSSLFFYLKFGFGLWVVNENAFLSPLVLLACDPFQRPTNSALFPLSLFQ